MPSKRAKSRPPRPTGRPTCKRVAILAFPGVTLLDISGPAQVFAEVPREATQSSAPYSLSYLSLAGGVVVTDVGLAIESQPLTSVVLQDIDTLIIPGGPGVWDLQRESPLLDWIKTAAPSVRRIASVCLGAFVLAWTGVLSGRRAVTHWRQCAQLAESFPDIRVEPNAIFVNDGSVWSSAGVSAGIDLALAMVEEDYGHQVALDIARCLVVFLKRPGGQSQFSTVLAAQASDVEGRFSALHAWMSQNIAGDLNIDALADKAGMSRRSFTRTYAARTGMTPARGVESLRVETARLLLESAEIGSMAQIAHRAGFGDDERMRRAFIRHLGLSPSEYRSRFVE